MQNKYSKNAKNWFSMADDDLEFAKAGFKETKIASDACFLSQQIVEKYLKGFLIYMGESFKKIHNLVVLLNQCVLLNKNFKIFYSDCKILNKYYNPARYPDDIFIDYSEKDGEEAIKSAERVAEFVQKLIKSNK